MSTKTPTITGLQLIRLLELDDWIRREKQTEHGVFFHKRVGGAFLSTTIPPKNDPIPDGTLSAILGSKQTKLGKDGLRDLIEKHGIS